MQFESEQNVLAELRRRGLRITPQRRAIVAEVMKSEGHITPSALYQVIQVRVPGVNPSTVYRTLEVLEEIGLVSHAHLEAGAEYHLRSNSQHVHLTCSRCGAEDSLSMPEAAKLQRLIARHEGFEADLTHFAISGLCARCQGELSRSRSEHAGAGVATA